MSLPIIEIPSIPDMFARAWDDILIKFTGKHLAILGARGVGKTHLWRILTTGDILTENKQTLAPENTSARRFPLKGLDLKIKRSLDLAGGEASRGEWKSLCSNADIVFYLLRADQLIKGDNDVKKRVETDIGHISGWMKERMQERKTRPLFFIIGTHCDLDEEFQYSMSADKIGDYTDKFRQIPIIKKLVQHAGGAQHVKVVLGSMKTVQDTESLVYEIFRQVTL